MRLSLFIISILCKDAKFIICSQNTLLIIKFKYHMSPKFMCKCAVREVLEETGLCINNVQFGHVTNDIMKEQGKHYVTIFMMAECVGE